MVKKYLSLVCLLLITGVVSGLDIKDTATSPSWENWIGNLSYQPSVVGDQYYFTPTTNGELREIITQARIRNIKIRVSGQRHATPPLVVGSNDNSVIKPNSSSVWVVDLSCYHDLGTNENETIILNKHDSTVTVNAGVREDYLNAFLTANNYMLLTVTAGGFFSLGGIAAVDVHGATINSTNIPGNIVAYTVVGEDGVKKTYDSNSPKVRINNTDYNPLQFHRASLGALGVITSVTVKVASRPFKNTLVASQGTAAVYSRDQFIKEFKKLFNDSNARVETFYNPYTTLLPNMSILKWTVNHNPSPGIPNDPNPLMPTDSCTIAKNKSWGAPYIWQDPSTEASTENFMKMIQVGGVTLSGALAIDTALTSIKGSMNSAIKNNNALWLDKAMRIMALSYFIPLPEDTDHGLGVAWDALNDIRQYLILSNSFVLTAPVEFRFVRSDDSVLSGSYTSGAPHRFMSVEFIGFVSQQENVMKNYPQEMLNAFARIECAWAKRGGMPHNGKAYGFYNPNPGNTQACKYVTGTMPFNPGYINYIKTRRPGLKDFEAYQYLLDPKGMFCTSYLKTLGVCKAI